MESGVGDCLLQDEKTIYEDAEENFKDDKNACWDMIGRASYNALLKSNGSLDDKRQ